MPRWSVKRGRSHSAFGGVAALLVGAGGVVWTAGAASMGAPPFFVIFGIIFVLIALVGAAGNFHDTTAKRRFSVFDITDDEPDPLDPVFGNDAPARRARRPGNSGGAAFCPRCGKPVEAAHDFCPNCGHDL